jgi:hypothetical protein
MTDSVFCGQEVSQVTGKGQPIAPATSAISRDIANQTADGADDPVPGFN